MIRSRQLVAVSVALALAGCIHIYEPRPAATSAGPVPAPAGKPEDKVRFKPWAEVLKDTKPIKGFLTLHQKRDNALLLELGPDQLDHDFGMVLHISRGVMGVLEQGAPSDWEARLMRFKRVGDQIQLIHRNPHYTANAGSPIRASVEDNVGHAVVATFKVESEHKDSKAVLIDATPFFVSDYADLAARLKFMYGNKPVMFEKEKSYVAKVTNFEGNTEIDADLAFRGSDAPVFGAQSLSDHRFVPLRLRYSLFELPKTIMTPRLADDRMGHFLDAVWDYSRDQQSDWMHRYVRRWRLEKKDPNAALSEPVKPIVYYIDRTVPMQYRRYVKEGIEAWNKAFETAGFRNAIVAREVPENDSTWSAEDARYSTVRWTPDPWGWAYGPSQTDPRSGEILNADVIVSAGIVTFYRNEYQELLGADAFVGFAQGTPLTERLHMPLNRYACFAQIGKQQQLAFQHSALLALDVIAAAETLPEEFLGDALRDLIMHEIGHTLGLRHNFRGSSGVPYDKLHDKGYTQEHGLTLSVMDYPAVNVASDPKLQGHYYNQEIGTYDAWTVKYAYAPVERDAVKASGAGELMAAAEAELPALRKIASEAALPLHTYGTDEDNWLGGMAIDPLTNAWDLGSDPVRYARERVALVEMLQPKLEKKLIASGDGYQRLRGAVTNMLFERYSSLTPTIKAVGGLYFARDHKGDANARSPFTPVPAAEQKAAVQLIVDHAFAESAFKVDATLLNKLAPSRWADWSAPWGTQVDYPLVSLVGSMHTALLRQLLDNARLTRMIENTMRAGEDYTVAELISTLHQGIWSEPARTPIRRNLQRSYVSEMVRLMLNERPLFAPSAPEDARSLARYELLQLSEQMGRALSSRANLDATTRAHLLETKARADRALAAQTVAPAH
jgi:hypothetical protein